MDDYKQRYLELKSHWHKYYPLQVQLRKDRRIILLCACVLCLFIGFMAGMILFYPKEHVVVSVQVPKSQSQVIRYPRGDEANGIRVHISGLQSNPPTQRQWLYQPGSV